MQVSELAEAINRDANLARDVAQDPVGTINAIAARHPLMIDAWIYRAVVIILGLAIIAGSTLYFILILRQVPNIPDAFVAIATTALGALAGLLAPSPARQ